MILFKCPQCGFENSVRSFPYYCICNSRYECESEQDREIRIGRDGKPKPVLPLGKRQGKR